MDLVEGVDFLQWVRPHGQGSFDEARLRSALAELAIGITAIHSAGKVHCDIKPPNIKVTPNGRVVLLDFGLAEPVGTRHSQDSIIRGSVGYMAPEQATGQPTNEAADWYSFGTVLYESLVGALPFTGEAQEVLIQKTQRDVEPPQLAGRELPSDLVRLCTSLLRRTPESRASGDQVLAALVEGTADAISIGVEQEPPFVGRDGELQELHRAFDRNEGRPRVVTIRGDSGVGKTHLLKHFASRVRSPKTLLLWGRCYERERLPYKALDGIIDELAAHLASEDHTDIEFPADGSLACHLFPVLRRVPVLAAMDIVATTSMSPAEQRALGFAALGRLLRTIAKKRRLLLVIDDLQWADSDSFELLRELLGPNGAPIMLCATVRANAALPAWFQHLATAIELHPLAADDTRELLAQLSPELVEESPEAAAAIAREAAGHPLFLQELVRQSGRAEMPDAPSLQDALRSRIDALQDKTRELLVMAAISGRPLSRETASLAAGVRAEFYDKELSRLRIANLVRIAGGTVQRVEPYHDRVREAVLSSLSDRERRAVHRRVGNALDQNPGEADPEELLLHLAAAGEKSRAAHYARVAAERASATLAFEHASQLYRSALSLGSFDPQESRALRRALGDSLAQLGRGSEAAAEYLAVARTAEDEERLDCWILATGQLLVCGQIELGTETMRRLLKELELDWPKGKPQLIASILRHRTGIRIAGLDRKTRNEDEIDPVQLRKLDALIVISQGMAFVEPLRAADFAVRALRLALQTGEARRICETLILEIGFRSTQGNRSCKRALELLERGHELAQAQEDPGLIAFVEAMRGVIAFYTSRFNDAERHADQAQALFDQVGTSGFEQNGVRLFRCLIQRYGGAVNLQRDYFEAQNRDAVRRGDKQAQALLSYLCSRIWLADDNPNECQRQIDTSRWPDLGTFQLPQFLEAYAHGELALYRGMGAQYWQRIASLKDRLSAALLLRIQSSRAEYYWLRGRLALAAAYDGAKGAHRDAKRSAKQLHSIGQKYSSVWAGLLDAAIATLNGEDAAPTLHATLELAEGNSLRLCAAAARYRLDSDSSEALTYARNEGIVNPARFFDLIVPTAPQ